MQTKHKKLLKQTAFMIPILLLGILIYNLIPQEPLTPDAVLAKGKWNDEELSRTLGRSLFMGVTDPKKRGEMMKKLDGEMKKRSPEQQQAIQQQAFHYFLDNAITQYRAMPVEQRKTIINKIADVMDQASEHEQEIQPEDRANMKEAMERPEAKAAMNTVMTAVQQKLSSDERVELAPVMKKWVGFLERNFQQ